MWGSRDLSHKWCFLFFVYSFFLPAIKDWLLWQLTTWFLFTPLSPEPDTQHLILTCDRWSHAVLQHGVFVFQFPLKHIKPLCVRNVMNYSWIDWFLEFGALRGVANTFVCSNKCLMMRNETDRNMLPLIDEWQIEGRNAAHSSTDSTSLWTSAGGMRYLWWRALFTNLLHFHTCQRTPHALWAGAVRPWYVSSSKQLGPNPLKQAAPSSHIYTFTKSPNKVILCSATRL